MTVLLTILKGIGWILLGILGLILLTVLTVLLVPIRYRADGVWNDDKYVRARVTWLLHLLSLRVTYEKELLLEVRVAGFLIYPKKERSGKKKKAVQEADAEESAVPDAGRTEPMDASEAEASGAAEGTSAAGVELPDEIDDTEVSGSAAAEVNDVEPQSADPNDESAARSDGEASATKDAAPGASETQSQEAEVSKAQKTGSPDADKTQAADSDTVFDQSTGSFFEKFSGKFSKIADRLRGMQQKTDQLKQQIAYYKRIWDQPQTRQAIRVGFYELGEIIRHVLPRKLEVFGIVGTGDPASTGQILAIQGMLYPWHKGNIRLEPDFEEKHIEGELHLKGRIRLGTLGICGLRILLNKNVRRLIRILRKKEEA